MTGKERWDNNQLLITTVADLYSSSYAGKELLDKILVVSIILLLLRLLLLLLRHRYPQLKEEVPAKEQGSQALEDQAGGGKQHSQVEGESAKTLADVKASKISEKLQKLASKRPVSKVPPLMVNMSLVLPRPLVRPWPADKKGRKVNLQAATRKNIHATSGKNLQATSRKKIQAISGLKLQASTSNLQAKSRKKTNIQPVPKAPCEVDSRLSKENLSSLYGINL